MAAWSVALVLWVNAWLAQSPARFNAALFLTDRVPWVLCALALVALWFAPGETPAATLDETDPVFAHRQRVLFVWLGGVLGFTVGRWLAVHLHVPRPFTYLPLQAPLPPEIWAQVQAALGPRGGFPSDQAAFWGALCLGVTLLRPRWATLAWPLALGVSLLRMGLGYHELWAALAGYALGMLALALVWLIQERLRWLLNPALLLFERVPWLAYGLTFFPLLDVTQRLAWYFGLLANLFGFPGGAP